jgi:DNA polymerase IV
LTNATDIANLPGCGNKIGSVFKEYSRHGTIAEYEHLKSSNEFQTLKLFWGVWGCGPHTARQWYFDRGWRSLDDIIEQGWDSISRVQQIGIKYYEEFNEHKISRAEVDEIGKIVGDASQVVAPGTVYEICGGYRRGKSESGDCDIIISNPRPHATLHLCIGLVKVLEERGYITHTLTISTATSDRDENPKISLRQKPALGERGGYGLDSLDKALVVFLLPKDSPFYTGIHRRVDLIIAPWRAWGTAIAGWTVSSINSLAYHRVEPPSNEICDYGRRRKRT